MKIEFIKRPGGNDAANKESKMKHVVSFSGGRTSAYLVHLMEQKRKHEGWDVHYVFMDTGAEHPATYDFVRDVVEKWKIPLICLRVDINPTIGKGNGYREMDINQCKHDLEPWKSMLRKYGTPYIGGAFCTDRLKLVPYTKYCNEHFGRGGYVTWLGIRADEPRRLSEKDGFRYLAELSDFDKDDVLDWWSEQSFDLKLQEHLGNCVFCIKKSINKVALAAKDEPKLAKQFNEVITDKSVRIVESRTSPSEIIYRGRASFSQVIAMFSEHDRDEMFWSLQSSKRYDTGSCSESCEVFSGEAQMDMFDEN